MNSVGFVSPEPDSHLTEEPLRLLIEINNNTIVRILRCKVIETFLQGEPRRELHLTVEKSMELTQRKIT
jgi:hypothetical protein